MSGWRASDPVSKVSAWLSQELQSCPAVITGAGASMLEGLQGHGQDLLNQRPSFWPAMGASASLFHARGYSDMVFTRFLAIPCRSK